MKKRKEETAVGDAHSDEGFESAPEKVGSLQLDFLSLALASQPKLLFQYMHQHIKSLEAS